ncbi:Nucleoside diphosphate kinase [uncultured Ruminococcus sp.]|uniref:nucleoside-diphosphate kinase n=1 Tax=Massiliimalia timonensis TaxID=1987501 RepID=A0A8J6PCC9_9FIRM|nr:nucleoside-diphosphate kinase [Massiliimalia timonensis]MBC8611677.1 hypothetical protein [Massiliimalia timonensis]SCH58499.1 Nucleoside diphosphate kinase [uncultured Clostridium sp.]SCH71503.1 Nucleoside diphosphate kinase [uncultured Ruminococcus sp.]
MYYSFIMLKPDALKRHLVEQIMQYFKKEGIEIERLGFKKVDEQLIDVHYAHVIEKYGDVFRSRLMDYFNGQDTIPMILKSGKESLVADIRRIVGATDPSKADHGTIRGDLGDDSFDRCASENRSCYNLIHASDSFENAKEETAVWFGKEVSEQYFGK